MSCNLAIIEQVALYLGRPWKVNHLREQSNWRYEIIDGQGRGLFFRVEGQKFRVSGSFSNGRTQSYSSDYKTIGVSIARNPKDIAADISRRLLPHYFRAWQIATERYQDTRAKKDRQELILRALCKVGQGKVSAHCENPKRVYFENAQAELHLGSDEVRLKLDRLTPEKAIQILGLLDGE
ncbi:MAG: hypothetical protein GY743_09905 [Planctomycetaceae bacterium]|nr:hypothetical protein [Planctomycetaceae bacterium]